MRVFVFCTAPAVQTSMKILCCKFPECVTRADRKRHPVLLPSKCSCQEIRFWISIRPYHFLSKKCILNRFLTRSYTTPHWHPTSFKHIGFLGRGHVCIALVDKFGFFSTKRSFFDSHFSAKCCIYLPESGSHFACILHGSIASANEKNTLKSITHESFILICFCIYNKVIEWESQAQPPPPELIVVECGVGK